MAIMKPEVIPAVTIPDQFNAATLFVDRHLAEGRGTQPAIICEGAITTYAQLAELTNRVGNGLYFPFGVGASAVHFPGKATPEDVLKVVQEQRPTLFFTVPTLYGAMLALPDAAKRFDFSSVRLCVSAGEALPADILRRWQDTFHVDILDGIGSTEILHIFISNRPGDIRPGSTGKLVPGYDARIVDEQGQMVPTGELGSLQISGDSTLAYYWNTHEKTKDTIMGR